MRRLQRAIMRLSREPALETHSVNRLPSPAALLLALLTGCASTSTLMVSEDGRIADCSTWGAGGFGAAFALKRTQDCIDGYEAMGYRATGAPPRVGVQQIASPAAAQTSISLPSRDGLFRITLPGGWSPLEPPSQTYQLFARNPALDSAFLVSAVESGNLADWEAHAGALRDKLGSSLAQATVSPTQRIRVNGFDALQAEVSGELKNGIKLHYLGTAIKTDAKLIWLVAWCGESRFAANRSELAALAGGLQMQ